ncbi:hypothetical protein F4677DRAFT_414011 [Hypoxylon crocopeplum]|nr:hypothetical protein F4677DRAFT_414011 [Hypoxylon crocopeplum]
MSSTAAFPPPVNPDDLGRGPLVMGLTWTFSGLAVITTLLRLYVRKRIAPRLSIEDYLMVLSMLLQLVNQIFVSIAFTYGMGKHQYDLVFPDQVVPMFMWEWYAVPPGLASGIFGRISICIFLVRLFGIHTWFKHYAIVLTGCGVVVSIVIGVCAFASRDPVQSLWNPLIMDTKNWDPKIVPTMMYLGQSFYALADLTFVIFPIIIVWKLNMSLNRRLGLIALIALSLFTCAMSIMKGISAHSQQSGNDASYDATLSLLWATLEQACVVLLGNLVPLRALLKLDIPVFSAVANSMASLLGRRSNSSTKPSELSDTSGYGKAAYRDIEMDTRGLGNWPKGELREVKGNASYDGSSARSTVGHGQVRRTDAFTLSYDSAGAEPASK